jgi:hypothetical protein
MTSPAILPQRTPSLQNLRTRALVLVHVLFYSLPKTRPRRPQKRLGQTPTYSALWRRKGEREDVSSVGPYPGLESATPDWVWTASLTKPVQRCQTLFRYLEILKNWPKI